MKNKLKIIIPLIIILLIVCVGIYRFSVKNEIGNIEAVEIPFGLEWGMNQQEFRQAMSNQLYMEDESLLDSFFSYKVANFLGIEGANATVALRTNEQGELVYIQCSFSSNEMYDMTTSPKMLDQLKKAFEEAYEKNCQEVLTASSDIFGDTYYYVYDQTLVSIYADEEHLYITFEDKSDESVQALIKELT